MRRTYKPLTALDALEMAPFQETDMPAETWLDHMPAIPLARGVPVVRGPRNWRGCVVQESADPDSPLLVRLQGRGGTHALGDTDIVDLGSGQGWRYAISKWLERGNLSDYDFTPDFYERADRFVLVTDADRIDLAKALAEVTP